jgi:hypothetical protein
MRLDEASPAFVREVWSRVEPALVSEPSLERAARRCVDAFYDAFQESVVLLRAFLTVAFETLPPFQRAFVERLAAAHDAAEQLGAATPVLSLLATRGVEPYWNDRRSSQGHVGIPFLNSRFITGVPMVAALLKELGLSLDWIDRQDAGMLKRALGRSTGLFLVEHASSATDTLGRKIISAQDFVERYGIESVFGAGGAYFGGQILVYIAFCRHHVPRSVAHRYTGLVNFFKARTLALATPGRIFDEDAVAATVD